MVPIPFDISPSSQVASIPTEYDSPDAGPLPAPAVVVGVAFVVGAAGAAAEVAVVAPPSVTLDVDGGVYAFVDGAD